MVYIEGFMRRTQIYLEASQRKLLQAIATDRHMTVSELIRQAIWDLLARCRRPKADPLSEIIGIYRNPSDPKGAVLHDDLYDE